MNWNTTEIAKVCLRTRMRDPRRNPDSSFLYVDISTIDRNLKVITSVPEIPGAEAPSRARKEICENDVLVSTVRPNLNAVAIVPQELDGQIASTGFCVLRPKPSAVDGKYLFYFAITSDFIRTLSSQVRGAHYPAVSDGDVKRIRLPLPPLKEQKRIVEILDQADALRRKRTEADVKAASILPALFYKMFGDPAINPMGWPIATLDEVTSVIHRYPTFYGVDYIADGVPVVRIGDIMSNYVLNKEMKGYVRVPKDFSEKFPLTVLEPDDIVMAVRGDTTGKIGMVPKELKGANISPNLIRISPRKEVINPMYLFSFLLTSRHNLGQLITNTAKKSITAKNLKTVQIIVPNLNVQKKYEEIILNFYQIENNRVGSGNSIDKLWKSMLHRAFIGDLTAKWRKANMKELLEEMENQSKELNLEKVRS